MLSKYLHSIPLADSHIGNSRDISFQRLIQKQTQGKGVDIVLNSLSEEKQLASLRCLAYGGEFLEIGKYDLTENSPLHLELLNKGATFHGVCLDIFLNAETHKKSELIEMLKDGISNGAVKPLRRICFGESELEGAYRYMASGKHIGKVLLKIREGEATPSRIIPLRKLVEALPR